MHRRREETEAEGEEGGKKLENRGVDGERDRRQEVNGRGTGERMCGRETIRRDGLLEQAERRKGERWEGDRGEKEGGNGGEKKEGGSFFSVCHFGSKEIILALVKAQDLKRYVAGARFRR